MALTVYPAETYDSFISLVDALDVITKNSVHLTSWTALTDVQQDVYLRIATARILAVIDSSLLDGVDTCLAKSCALMAVRDVVYAISSSVNPNTGLVSKEKVGDVEVTYFHGNPIHQISSRNTNPFSSDVIVCMNNYGAEITVGGIQRARLVRS